MFKLQLCALLSLSGTWRENKCRYVTTCDSSTRSDPYKQPFFYEYYDLFLKNESPNMKNKSLYWWYYQTKGPVKPKCKVYTSWLVLGN